MISGAFFQPAPLVTVARGRLAGWWRGCVPLLGDVEGALVFGADGGVEQWSVAQAHLGGGVAEEGHQ